MKNIYEQLHKNLLIIGYGNDDTQFNKFLTWYSTNKAYYLWEGYPMADCVNIYFSKEDKDNIDYKNNIVPKSLLAWKGLGSNEKDELCNVFKVNETLWNEYIKLN